MKTEEKQIEEMAKYIRPVLKNRVDIGFIPDLDKPIAKTLIEQGYRKVNKDECEYWKSRCKEIGDVAYEKARKEAAEKILSELWHAKLNTVITVKNDCSREDIESVCKGIVTSLRSKLKELAKQFGVEVEE